MIEKVIIFIVPCQEILVYNMREEPVLFVNIADDFLPYTIKKGYDLKTCIVTGKVNKEAELFEADVRREVKYMLK